MLSEFQTHLDVLAGHIFHHSRKEIRCIFPSGNHLRQKNPKKTKKTKPAECMKSNTVTKAQTAKARCEMYFKKCQHLCYYLMMGRYSTRCMASQAWGRFTRTLHFTAEWGKDYYRLLTDRERKTVSYRQRERSSVIKNSSIIMPVTVVVIDGESNASLTFRIYASSKVSYITTTIKTYRSETNFSFY